MKGKTNAQKKAGRKINHVLQMDNKILKKAKSMALEAGYQDVKLLRPWRTCEVIEPIFTDGNCHFIGEPMYMLAKGNKIRWTKANEAFEIMRAQKEQTNE